jgi:hypothetical protein
MARSNDSNLYSSASATTSPVFMLKGGKYAVSCTAGTWGSGSVTLEYLGPDGATYLAVSTGATFAANGYTVVDLPPGDYKWVVASATTIAAQAVRIPND